MPSNEILSVHDLSLALCRNQSVIPLVSNLSFSLRPNRVMGLIGESGCGKSLTCLAIMGLLPENIQPSGGEIRVNGRQLTDMTPSEKTDFRGKTAAIILQNPMSCFDSVFKIRHHFYETLTSHGEKNPARRLDVSRHALLDVGFEHPDEILDLYPFQMSGGMLQRIMIAMAVMMNVSLLIADEPTTDLDVVSQARILDLLAQMRDRHGMAILLVTHDLSVVARLADDLTVMKEGRVVESGPLATLFHAGQHPYTRALITAHLSMYDDRLQQLLGPAAPKNAAQAIRQGETHECVGTEEN
ncbi:ABC transporter ATP-binding protein [Desulfoluna sp.]|uniref:ABC transporter ATP-binding protein n=1 Tax=Desulfoluna sp. TaxID=2045199 RepID=UPI0026157813|nr:ABC transporter ATP-binding protein [Desulfoluna sp.]